MQALIEEIREIVHNQDVVDIWYQEFKVVLKNRNYSRKAHQDQLQKADKEWSIYNEKLKKSMEVLHRERLSTIAQIFGHNEVVYQQLLYTDFRFGLDVERFSEKDRLYEIFHLLTEQEYDS